MSHDGASALELSDTSPRAHARALDRLRQTSPRARLERALRLSERVRSATMANVKQLHPGATRTELQVAFLRRVYGDAIAEAFAARHR